MAILKCSDKAISKTDGIVVFSMSLLPPGISFLYTKSPGDALTVKEDSG